MKSAEYWELRYSRGGNSGAGSRGSHAEFKAGVLNEFVAEHGVTSVIEFGCGDGEQLALADYPRYLGFDVSPTTLRQTKAKFEGDASKSFALYDPELYSDPAGMITSDLVLSLDVIFHLTEDDVYERHLEHVFGASRKYVVLYTSDLDDPGMDGEFAAHMRHHPVLRDVAKLYPDWRLTSRIENPHPWSLEDLEGSISDFFIYERADNI